MAKDILELQPGNLWKNFYSLTQIPRPSKKEAKVIAFMKKFGEDLGLETHVDEVGNVLIKKPATVGYENKKTVVLQSHLDMVPQKNSDKVHDFEKDPIDAYVDGDWVTANATTLGSDNGMGVAAAMSVLESKEIKHPSIEALFTIDEETGMTGAFNLKPDFLTGDIMLNLDSEDEGELYIGCAGGINTNAVGTYQQEDIPAGYKAFRVDVKGLKGGHSGLDIVLKRGNAIKILNRLLINANENLGVLIAEFEGGNLRNAIPREAYAIALVPEAEIETFKTYAEEIRNIYINTIATEDTGLTISLKEVALPEKMMSFEDIDKFTNAIHALPNGVIEMSKDMENTVETSTNLAIVKAKDGKIEFSSLQRSFSDAAKDELSQKMKSILEEAGYQAEIEGSYPGWKPNINSPILKTMKEIYNNRFGKIPEIKSIHAGLECGLIGGIYPNLDMISFGPTIRFPHSPDEKVKIDTVQKFWDFLVATLENIPE